MERSRLPLQSLLGLFGALLMLSPELLLGIAGSLSDVPVTDPGVQEALAFAVEQYNQERRECVNYFKQLRLLKALSQERNCYFIVRPRSPPNEMTMETIACV
ncbi:cystatin-like [Pantherophis guttatus]|uniref:Cystatin-like n=1 Tax=Pantherophis guttatus TaxID=94885 RepID=A0ABM3YQU7_PANGU|nr:cystatin-like [Pantherophis guttatus]